MRRGLMTAALAALLTVAAALPAAASGAGWQLEQPSPPPAPPGVTSVDRPLGLGTIGDIEFWSPNRGLLITGGNPPAIPAGLWAYDGVVWHLLSTVCGSANGRIAWAGPDEFWTISDPAPNSEQAGTGFADTLCHFVNGAVVASYASPTGASDPYVTMLAAACNGPSDCWFAGRAAQAPLTGTFHLHWDGTTLTDVLGPQDREVVGLAALQGQFFESVAVNDNGATQVDNPVPPESTPVLLHRIVEGLTPDQEFADEPFTPAQDATVPSYLTLGTDGSDLWAVGGPTNVGARPPLAARYVNGTFEELPIDATKFSSTDAFLGVAPEPGAGDAWVTVGNKQRDPQLTPPASVARIAANGTIELDTVPATGSGQVDHGSAAGPIACPAVKMRGPGSSPALIALRSATDSFSLSPTLRTVVKPAKSVRRAYSGARIA